MKKIVIVDGGPRKNFNTAAMMQKFAEGARSAGEGVENSNGYGSMEPCIAAALGAPERLIAYNTYQVKDYGRFELGGFSEEAKRRYRDEHKMTIDTTNMCSHLQRKLFDENGEYHRLWLAMQEDAELTAVVRSRQLHIYRNGKKVLVLAGKAAPKTLPRGPLHRARETRKGLWEGVAETPGAAGCGAQLRPHGVDMSRLEPAGPEGVP